MELWPIDVFVVIVFVILVVVVIPLISPTLKMGKTKIGLQGYGQCTY